MTNALKIFAALLTLALCAGAFAADAKDEGFITEWLVGGPYPSYQVDGQGKALDADFLNKEASFEPWPGLKAEAKFDADWGKLVAGLEATNEWGFREPKTFDASWSLRSSKDFKLSFTKAFSPIENYFAVYAICWIESPDKRRIKIGVGSDDDHKLYLDGKLLGRHYGSQGTIPDQFVYDAELHPGLNRLTFKLVNRTGDADFCVRLMDAAKKPMKDLILRADNPGRRWNAELFHNGYAGNLAFASEDLLAGTQKLSISVFTEKPGAFSLRLNGKPAEQGETDVDLVDGKNLLKLEVLVDGAVVAILQKEILARSKESLSAENEALRQELKKISEAIPAMKLELQALEKELEKAQAERKKAYASLEKRYAERRAEACKDAKKSVDESLAPASVRSRLCVNGEWEASLDRKSWSELVLPARMYNDYFRTWWNPVKNADPKNPYGKVVPLKGWEGFTLSPLLCAKSVWFRKSFVADGETAVTFVCGSVKGKLQAFLNGAECGAWSGCMGQVEIPLNGVKRGENSLELHFERDALAFGSKESYGILGDLFLDFSSPVRMEDVWVKTSWRKATISLVSELENRTDEEKQVEVRQCAVKDGRVKLKLPPVRLTLPPRKISTFSNAEKWADPALWGIGGVYGEPELHELVSDVFVDGKLVDRHVQSFGFREFWIHATDFYLNGRRVILQGDVGEAFIDTAKFRDVLWPLLRKDGVNTVRFHDSFAQGNQDLATAADKAGMLSYVQMHPAIFPGNVAPKNGEAPDAEAWLKTPEHQYNLENFRRWHRLFRNNPSVVIWSSDNELFTQAVDSAAQLERNIRNDKIGALYEKFMKTLDPELVMTRDGDIGTWGRSGRWFEEPPCDTANYHYPEFNVQERIVNWQKTYDFRPLVLGETFYNAYFGKGGSFPDLVEGRAKQIRQIGGLYRRLEVPAQIFMGLSSDGFVVCDDSGKGNPWGVTKTMRDDYVKNGVVPPMLKDDQYPWFRVKWPALSGKGRKDVFGGGLGGLAKTEVGANAVNWFDPSRPTHVRNAVNDAYRDTLLPQAPLRTSDEGECVIATAPFAVVWSVAADGTRYGTQADKKGRAWFQLPSSGKHSFEADGVKKDIDVPSRKPYAAKPGFENVAVFELKKGL